MVSATNAYQLPYRGTWRNARETHSMKICDLCKKVTNHLHAGPKAAESVEVCDDCHHDLMERIAKLQKEEATMRERLWTDMIENWKCERSAPAGATST
jgi:ribosome-binding protein aMBF1 (putative translation factor)